MRLSTAQPKTLTIGGHSTRDLKIWREQVKNYIPIKLTPSDRPTTRHLIFHCYPKINTNWREATLDTLQHRDVFNGKVFISVTSGKGCEDVGSWFKQFGPTNVTTIPNEQSKGINTTFRDQLQAIRNEQGIVFKSHTKGVSHDGDPFKSWRQNMATLCLQDTDRVTEQFSKGYLTFGAFKTYSPEGAIVMGQINHPWPSWHYPGAFYWFRPSDITNKFLSGPLHHYENEAFPCHIGPTETGYSVTPDNINFTIPQVIIPTPEQYEKAEKLGPWICKFNGVTNGWFDVLSDKRPTHWLNQLPPNLRVVECGSLEGGHTLLIARHSNTAKVLGLEAREANLNKCRFVHDLYNIENSEFMQCDLDETSELPVHDALFCSGVLYHLLRPVEFLNKLTAKYLFLGTHYSKTNETTFEGQRGKWYQEHGLEDVLSGMSDKSFWLTLENIVETLHSNNYNITDLNTEDAPNGPWVNVTATRK